MQTKTKIEKETQISARVNADVKLKLTRVI